MHALLVMGHLKAIHFEGDAFLTESEEASNPNHEAFNVLSVFAEDEIADATDLRRLIDGVDSLTDQIFCKNCVGVLHNNLARYGHLGGFGSGRGRSWCRPRRRR